MRLKCDFKFDIILFMENLYILKNLNILFIEDNEVMLESTKNTLELFFNRVYIAKTVDSAIEIYYEKNINFIITDLKLRDENALEFVSLVREKNYSIPIVILTSYSDREYLLKASNLSIDGYILKPFKINQFIEILSKSIERNIPSNILIELKCGVVFDYVKKEILKNCKIIHLGKRERELIELLINSKNIFLTKQDLISKLWPFENITDSALKSLINRIRKKICSEIILTSKGNGFKIGLKSD